MFRTYTNFLTGASAIAISKTPYHAGVNRNVLHL